MFRFLLAILCLIASINIINASQNMVILNTETKDFPLVSVDYFVFDDSSVLPNYNVNAGQITVLDNGNNMPVISHDNFTGDVNKQVSLDISFDLGLNVSNGNFVYAKKIAAFILNNFDFNAAEVSLSAFDTYTFLYKDFTADKTLLLNTLDKLQNASGSDLNRVFVNSPGSVVKVFEKGNYQKKALIITDGNTKINLTDEQIQNYINNNIQVNLVALGTTISDKLKNMINQTGGIYLDKVNNNIPFQDVARTMISWMYGVRPAKLTWDASASCDDNHVSEIFIPSSNADGAVDYYTLVSSKIRLAALPLNIKFNPILPGESDTREIYLEAVNGDIAIDKIELQNDILFDIIEGKVSSPFVLPKGQQHKVIVKYSPVDSTIQFTKLLITSSACVGNEVLIAAGYPNTPPKEKTIKITSPVCKETLILGDEHYVEWEGLLPEDVIQLEYSLNEGASWDTLATNVKGLKYKWDIPNVETDDALVRAIQLWPNNIGRTMNLKHWAQVNSAFFNTFGDKIVTASGDSSAVVWNSNTGAKLLTLKKHSHEVNYAVFSFDNQYIATASKDSTVILWNAVTGDSLGTIIQKEKVNSVNFSHNSKAIVTASSDGTVKIYDVNTLALIRNIDAYTSTKRAWYAEYDPTDSYILTAGNAVYARLYNAVGSGAGTLYKQFKVQESDYGDVAHATFNDNASKVALTSSNLKKTMVWDLKNLPDKDTYFLSDTLYSVTHNKDTSDNYFIRHASFARDNEGTEYLLTSGTDKKAFIWYAATGNPRAELAEHRSTISTAVMNFDGSRVLTASWDSTAKVWNLDQRDLQMDTIDCKFSIKKANITLNDISFGDIYRGIVVDSVFKKVIVNENKFPIEIRSLELLNDANEQFALLTELDLPLILLPDDFIDLEISVYPKASGAIKAQLQIQISGNVTIKSIVSANSMHEGLSVNNTYFDLGIVDFGEFRDSTLTAVITNNHSVKLDITGIYLDDPEPDNFRILEGADIKSINPGESRTLKVRYTPTDNVRNNSVLKLEHNLHQYPARINLLGEGVSPILSSCAIYLTDLEGKPGDIVELQIKIKNINEEGIRKTISGIRTYLSFNSTLLAPVETFEYDVTENNVRTIGIDLPLDIKPDSVLRRIKFHVGLGNNLTSELTLNNSVPIGLGKFDIKEESSLFTLKGVCEENGEPRLFDPNGKSILAQNTPNPFTLTSNIIFELPTQTQIELYVIDMTGKRVMTVADCLLPKGEHRYVINANDLENGVYRYILKTPYRIYSETMQVIK